MKAPALYDRPVFIKTPTSGEMKTDSLPYDIAWYKSNGYPQTSPDLSRVVYTRFAVFAHERLGPHS